MKKYLFSIAIISLLGFVACEKDEENPVDVPIDYPTNSSTPTFGNASISTDKAIYSPNDVVSFTLDISNIPSSAKVRYKSCGTVIEEFTLPGSTWSWSAPANDFTGYIAEVYSVANQAETIHATIGIDVSSNWTRFPRYGFLSKFYQMSLDQTNSVVRDLNRYHINGLQFYDWHNKHHKPLPVFNGAPASSWKDIINRDCYFSTVENYITSAHSYNMKAMFYNLIYGAWSSAEADGVGKEWFVYTDASHTNKDFHPLSSPFLSNIYLIDPSNTAWQNYLIAENQKVYQYLDFDGFHMDQLGDRGARYKYDGTYLKLADTYKPFIDAVKADEPNKYVAMNAVNQYGQQGISQSDADFLYTEVWSPYDSYGDLANLIKQNNQLANNSKNSVLAAYMNYDMANNSGYFNTPSILMTDAVIFAFGGAHLELGEHMLGKEYFPNSNLAMKDDLKRALVNYYDFLVGYQNLLRDGGAFNDPSLSSADSKMVLAKWPAGQGKVACFGRKVDNSQVIHLINFTNSQTQNWRDNGGIQTAPSQIKDAKLTFNAEGTVKRVWIASPDYVGGASREIAFVQNGTKVGFTLPELKYWSMVVVEY